MTQTVHTVALVWLAGVVPMAAVLVAIDSRATVREIGVDLVLAALWPLMGVGFVSVLLIAGLLYPRDTWLVLRIALRRSAGRESVRCRIGRHVEWREGRAR